jgi:hypothetical protein
MKLLDAALVASIRDGAPGVRAGRRVHPRVPPERDSSSDRLPPSGSDRRAGLLAAQVAPAEADRGQRPVGDSR